MMARVAAVVATILLAAVVGFQLALVAGAPWGEWTQGGAVTGALPAGGRIFAAVSALILVAFALGLLGRVGWGPLAGHRRLSTTLTWIAVVYGVLAVVLNAATPSGVERAVWLPFSLLLLAAELTTALASRRDAGRS